MLQLQLYYNIWIIPTPIPTVSFGASEGSHRHEKLMIND